MAVSAVGGMSENALLRLQFRFSGLTLFHWLSVIRESLKTGLPLSAKPVFHLLFYFYFFENFDIS